jgi:hypothetical protein
MAETGEEFPFKLGVALSFYVAGRALNFEQSGQFIQEY